MACNRVFLIMKRVIVDHRIYMALCKYSGAIPFSYANFSNIEVNIFFSKEVIQKKGKEKKLDYFRNKR